jgi:hypothetical protein
VPLIISYDPTAPMSASGNVSRVVNFYSSTNGWGTSIGRGPGFRGNLSNVDLSRRGEIGHTDIDKSPSLHAQSISYIQSIGSARASTTEQPKADTKDKGSSATSPAASTKNSESPGPGAQTTAATSKPAPAPAESAAAQPATAN